MAEAVVEVEPRQRFYFCHSCSVEIDNVTNEFTCPHCSNGFVEELTAPPENSTNNVEMMETENDSYADFNNRLTDELSTLFMSVTGARPPEEEENAQQATNRRRIRRRYGVNNFNHFDNILHDLLISVTGGAGGGTPMFFMGNPGDYAWGREGLDTIVTQLLNQMESTGPPPLPTEKIEEIPKVEITQDQVDIKLQCSVCWEDFQLNETVKQLTCQHVYHENCIVPWLELHGTCPVCRKSFVPEYSEEHQRNTLSAVAANSFRNVAAYIRSDNNDLSLVNELGGVGGGGSGSSGITPNIPPGIENPQLSSHPQTRASQSLLLNAINQLQNQQYRQQLNNTQQPPQTATQQQQQQQQSQQQTPPAQQQSSTQSNNSRRNNRDNRDGDGIVEYEYD